MNLELANLCCDCCELAYDLLAGNAASSRALIARRLKSVQYHTSMAVVLEFDEQRIVAFPGTLTEFGLHSPAQAKLKSLSDWWQNARFDQVLDSRFGMRGRVHRGMYHELCEVAAFVEKLLVEFAEESGDKPLILTGHSQGGGIAQLASVAFPLVGFPIAETYTFASPRVGDSEFASQVDRERLHRLEFGSDIVPHLPPSEDSPIADLFGDVWFPDYVSAGQLSYATPNGALVCDLSPHTEQLNRAWRATTLLQGRADWANHHHLFQYRAMLAKAL